MRLTILILLLIFPFIGSSQSKCKIIQKGKFYVELGNGERLNIKRTKRKQIERNPSNNSKIVNRIEWIDNCSYLLYNLRINKAYKAILSEEANLKQRFVVKIIAVENNSYYYQVFKENETKQLTHGRAYSY